MIFDGIWQKLIFTAADTARAQKSERCGFQRKSPRIMNANLIKKFTIGRIKQISAAYLSHLSLPFIHWKFGVDGGRGDGESVLAAEICV